MSIGYPNGIPSSFLRKSTPTQSKNPPPIEFGKRGMDFEEEINQSNAYYLSRGIAVIHKKPTPIQIVHVDYPSRNRAKITEAYFRHASTTDYNGVYNGIYIDFEAKMTKNKTSFPFANFHEHQILHMEAVLQQKGIAFVLLYFSSLNRVFLFPSSLLVEQYHQKKEARKSLKLAVIEKFGIEIEQQIAPRIPYLTAVDTFITNLKEWSDSDE